MNNSVKDLAADLENWMSLIPQELRRMPIINIAIPGSHDSFTANITSNSDISPDAEEIVKELSVLGPIFKEVIARWSKTQCYLAKDQLIRGIRYFDLRTSTKEGTDDLYIVHTLYSVPIQTCLDEINSFLDLHPKEVIIIYRIDGTTFWPSACFPNPWPNTVSIPTLIQSLNDNLKKRQKDIAFISQCVLTPDAKFILEHVLSSLEEECAKKLENYRSKWIEAQVAGECGLNIIIADFIDLSDCKYVRDVINVNQSLLKALNK
ncbi:PI-PLC X domain-containing protein 3-like isoform X2 [Diorhabda sublineata]|uniref:PI-PLC X domain-containing protein 3-like isoform X2 n=1 Tax=Diorhabda sublineata TaxID=1163346 RepID=UPI0024E04713|nr:PI-PLC X domain-containing protein 3-like isoform X2 [Diorhabda sublineata]